MNDIIPSDWERNQSLIKVIGVGGGGSNAVNHMYATGIQNVDFLVCNTDAQALSQSPVPQKLQLGQTVTRGRGAGCNPEVAREAAEESKDKIKDLLGGATEMVFVTAGMGGGTGTGATPVIARLAKEMGLLTVAVVTLPFRDEGREFLQRALDGIHELEQHVDSLLVIDNEKLYRVFGDLTIFDAFPHADDVLGTAVKGIAEIVTRHGYINVDFADVKMVMKDSGMALMGTGSASGNNRAVDAVRNAFNSPLLNDADLNNASNVLVNISSSKEKGLTMAELSQIMDYIKEYTGGARNFKRGVVCDPSLGESISVTVVATGFSLQTLPTIPVEPVSKHHTVTLEEQALEEIHSAAADTFSPPKDPTISTGPSTVYMPSGDVLRETASGPVSQPLILGRKPALILGEQDNIESLEKVPAYKRRGKNLKPLQGFQTPAEEPHPLHLQGSTGSPQLTGDNAYIHQNQD